MPLRQKIGVAIIKALPPNTTVWDTTLTGFCARRQGGPAVSYLFKMRVNGRIRWFTIGRHGQPWTPETARQRAHQILVDPSLGNPPSPADVRTFAKTAEKFIEIHGAKLKPRTREEQHRIFKLHLNPAFGDKDIGDITRADVETLHAKMQHIPRAANHAVAVLSSFMNWAELMGYRREYSNPCRRVKHYRLQPRERFLQRDELARLGAALTLAEQNQLESRYAIAALRLLLLTGARLSEILTLKWSYVDLSRQVLLLPDSKTGKKTIPLSPEACALLAELPRFANNPFVIVGSKPETHLVNLQKPWRAIRKIAGLDDVRIHDLRHTHASCAVAVGGSLPMIGKILGHRDAHTTQRYVHLNDDPLHQLVQSTGRAISEAMRAKPDAAE
jgi:integrase